MLTENSGHPYSFLNFLSVSMGPKRKMVLLTIRDSSFVPIPTERHTLLEHHVVKDPFWKRALNDTVEAEPAFEYIGSESIGSGMPLSRQVYKTLFDDSDGFLFSPRSILRLRVERE